MLQEGVAMTICNKTLRVVFLTAMLAVPGTLHPPCLHALTIGKVTFAESAQVGPVTLSLHNAALLRYLKFIKAYVAALYLPRGVEPGQVLSDVPKRLELGYLVPIKGPDFGKGAEPTLQRNHTPAELARLRSRIDRINAVYRDVQPGDRYALTYLPGTGTELALNGVPLVVIEGADFAAAYFGIWLGREPIDAALKSDLLRER
jgi:hypothetical protein